MITIHLMGGLGNQLFQIFATIAYALEYKHPFIFPYSETLTTGIERPTYWDTLFKSIKIFTTITQERGFTNKALSELPQYREPGFTYSKIPEIPIHQNFALHGYFQSPKYFEKYQTHIVKFLKIPEMQQYIRNQYVQYIDPSMHTISMHFRLGDYKYKQTHYPILPPEYYQFALLHLLTHIPKSNIRVLYFCEAEDNEHVMGFIDYLRVTINVPVDFVKVDDTIPDWQQLLLMSCCNGHIIANSTFSWWGAYLCNSNPMVCYPSTWFGPAMSGTIVDDLFPETWTKIDA